MTRGSSLLKTAAEKHERLSDVQIKEPWYAAKPRSHEHRPPLNGDCRYCAAGSPNSDPVLVCAVDNRDCVLSWLLWPGTGSLRQGKGCRRWQDVRD